MGGLKYRSNMRHFLILAALVLTACTANLSNELSEFLQTRSDAPLEGTVWEHNTGEQYNRYVTFRNGEMSLFYGLMEQDTLRRYSDFYSAPYALKGGLIVTELTYPLWGHREVTESVSVVKSKGSYTIDLDWDAYRYYGPWSDDLNDQWMTIIITIADMQDDGDKPSYPWVY